jgi:hypothetical protein
MLRVNMSKNHTHRFMALFQERVYWFGNPNEPCFLDGVHVSVRDRYIESCLLNQTKTNRIKELIPSTDLFEYYILWGNSRNVDHNIRHIRELLYNKYKWTL